MTNANDSAAFWLDWDHDRASGSRSRYSVYLRDHRVVFPRPDDYDDLTVPFAVAAWKVATGPIMAPGLVRSHARTADVSIQRSGWNGEALAMVDLIAPRPPGLAYAKDSKGRFFRDHCLSAWGTYDGVGEDDLVNRPFLGATLRMMIELPRRRLPTIVTMPTEHRDLYRLAVQSVEALVEELNEEVQPVLDALESN